MKAHPLKIPRSPKDPEQPSKTAALQLRCALASHDLCPRNNPLAGAAVSARSAFWIKFFLTYADLDPGSMCQRLAPSLPEAQVRLRRTGSHMLTAATFLEKQSKTNEHDCNSKRGRS